MTNKQRILFWLWIVKLVIINNNKKKNRCLNITLSKNTNFNNFVQINSGIVLNINLLLGVNWNLISSLLFIHLLILVKRLLSVIRTILNLSLFLLPIGLFTYQCISNSLLHNRYFNYYTKLYKSFLYNCQCISISVNSHICYNKSNHFCVSHFNFIYS